MMNVIFEEELWDKEFVDNWTFGFDELRERVKDFTPEKVSDICWIPKEHVIDGRPHVGHRHAGLHPGR